MLIGTDNYTALCRNCYNFRKNQNKMFKRTEYI